MVGFVESSDGDLALHVERLYFSYGEARFRLAIPSLSIASGSRVAVIGPSGSGKSTLFNLIMGLSPNFQGRVEVLGEDIYSKTEAERCHWRLQHVGFIPQNFALLDYLSVKEQAIMPSKFLGNADSKAANKKVDQLLERAGIAQMESSYPETLSQGERQRVAICRGLAHEPQLILADEPTGNLDPETQRTITTMIIDEATRLSATLLMITHDHSLLSTFDHVIDISQWSGKERQ